MSHYLFLSCHVDNISAMPYAKQHFVCFFIIIIIIIMMVTGDYPFDKSALSLFQSGVTSPSSPVIISAMVSVS